MQPANGYVRYFFFGFPYLSEKSFLILNIVSYKLFYCGFILMPRQLCVLPAACSVSGAHYALLLSNISIIAIWILFSPIFSIISF